MNRESKVHAIKDALIQKCRKANSHTVATVSDIAGVIGDCSRDDFYTLEIVIRVLFNVDKMRGKHYETGQIVVGFPVIPLDTVHRK